MPASGKPDKHGHLPEIPPVCEAWTDADAAIFGLRFRQCDRSGLPAARACLAAVVPAVASLQRARADAASVRFRQELF